MDVMIFIVIIVLSIWGLSKIKAPGPNRCYMAPPGESKVHTWVLKSTPDSKVLELQCKVCGQKPGED